MSAAQQTDGGGNTSAETPPETPPNVLTWTPEVIREQLIEHYRQGAPGQWEQWDDKEKAVLGETACRYYTMGRSNAEFGSGPDADTETEKTDALPYEFVRQAANFGYCAGKDHALEASTNVVEFTGEKPAFHVSASGLKAALLYLGYQTRYNERSGKDEFKKGEAKWKSLRDRKAHSIRDALAQRVLKITSDNKQPPYQISDKRFAELMAASNEQAGHVDPFVLYLTKALPDWDGEARLAGLVEQVFAVPPEEKELAKWAGRYLFMGAVSRALHPGRKQDESPVFIGPGESGKSSLVRLAIPKGERRAWFGDALNLSATSKEQVESILGKVIVEISEMAGASRAEVGRLKAFLSRQVDNSIRLAYGRRAETWPRRCIFVGTADREDCLPNDHNNRRFVPVRVKPKEGKTAFPAIRDYMDKWRPQLWAEALHRIEAGEHPRLPDELHERASESAEAARQRIATISDRVDEDIGLLIKKSEASENEAEKGLTLTEIIQVLDMEEAAKVPGFQNNLGTELRRHGWMNKQRRRQGRARMIWRPKGAF